MSKALKVQRLQKIVDLLKFVLKLDDEEIIKTTLESIIELLEEEIDDSLKITKYQ